MSTNVESGAGRAATPGRGRRGGRRGYNGRGRGRGPARGPAPATGEKLLPQFIKVADLKPGSRTFNVIVKVCSVNPDAIRVEKRAAGHTVSTPCTEALVGDETGSINLSTRLPEKATELKVGATLALLNVRMIRVGGDVSWIEVDTWATVKVAESCLEVLPAGVDLKFEVNKDVDRSRKIPPKPTFITVDALEPDAKGLHLLVKVLDVKVEERKRNNGSISRVTEATVGDEKARVILIAKGAHAAAVKKDGVFAIFNAHVEMYNKGFVRLVVDRWSDVKDIADVDPTLLPASHVNAESTVSETNKSTQEWILQEETA